MARGYCQCLSRCLRISPPRIPSPCISPPRIPSPRISPPRIPSPRIFPHVFRHHVSRSSPCDHDDD